MSLNRRIISSDNHIYEPPWLWEQRVAPRFRDRCPKLIDIEGGEAWVVDGYRTSFITQGTQPGARFQGQDNIKKSDYFSNVREGGYIPEKALDDMDIDGVDVSIIYPTVGLSLYYSVPDTDLFTALCAAYNDFTVEFCQAYPTRLKGIAMLNVDCVEDGVKELERMARMGMVGAMIPIFPDRMRYDSREYDNLWAAAESIGIPLSLHINTNRPCPDGVFGIDRVEFQKTIPQINVDYWVRTSLADLILGGVFDRYPNLYVGSVELDLAWIPHFLQRMDFLYTQTNAGKRAHQYKDGLIPSEVFRRNCFASFQEDAIGVGQRNFIGVDSLMWGADYPHLEGTWPRSQEIIEKTLLDCTDEEKSKIVCGNAARLYGLN